MKKFTIVVLSIVFGVAIFSQNQSVLNSILKKKQLKTTLTEQIYSPDFASISSSINQESFNLALDDYGNPPDWGNISHFGGAGAGYGRDIIANELGHIYVCGSFCGTITIGNESWTCVGNRDAFVAKFSSEGNLIWLKTLTAAVGETVDAYGINFDQEGNILITGYHTGTVSAGGRILNSKGGMTLYFAKYNTQGDLLMALNHENSGYDEIGLRILTDPDNNIYILGSSDGTVSFRNSTVLLKFMIATNEFGAFYYNQNFCDVVYHDQHLYFVGTVNSPDWIGDFYVEPLTTNDVFIAVSDLYFNFEMVTQATHGSNTFGNSYGIAIAVDNNGSILITGYFDGNIYFDPYFLNVDSNFAAKFDNHGNCLWLSRFDNYTTFPSSKDISCIDDNVYVTGSKTIGVYSLINGTLLDDNRYSGLFNKSYLLNDTLFVTGSSYNEKIIIASINHQLSEVWNNCINSTVARSYVINAQVDQFGNVYSFNNTNNPIIYKNIELQKGLFLTKENNNGDLLWLKNFPDHEDGPGIGNRIICDTTNEFVFITGNFSKTLIIPDQDTLIAGEDQSIFIIKYNFNGDFQWATQINCVSVSLCLATTQTGGVWISANFSQQVTIGNFTLFASGYSDWFVAKFTPDGICEWAERIGGSDLEEYESLIATDKFDNVYFTGEVPAEDVTIGNTPFPIHDGDGNILFAKFDESGNLLWVKSLAGSTIEMGDWNCWPTGIETDNEGYVYMKGWHGDSTFFDNIMLRNPYYDYGKFIAKFDQNGNTLWAKSITETHYGLDYNQMSVDNKGNVYLGFQVTDTLYFENFFMYPCANKYDMLTAKYNTSGVLEWAKFIIGTQATYCWMSSVTATGEDQVFCSGFFSNELNFANTKITAGNHHGFVAAIGSSTGISNPEGYASQNLFDIFPNPANDFINLTINTKDAFNISIIDNLGKSLMNEENIISDNMLMDISSFPANVYYVVVETKTGTEIRKLIVK